MHSHKWKRFHVEVAKNRNPFRTLVSKSVWHPLGSISPIMLAPQAVLGLMKTDWSASIRDLSLCLRHNQKRQPPFVLTSLMKLGLLPVLTSASRVYNAGVTSLAKVI